MYRDRGASGSVDKKRINDGLDKYLEKSSPSGSKGFVEKEKDRVSTSSGKHPEPRDHRSASVSKNEGNEDSEGIRGQKYPGAIDET